MYFIADQEL